jgi:hypothetical protein
MRKAITLITFAALLLSACRVPIAEPVPAVTEAVDAVATEVARQLTALPTATTVPSAAPSATLAPSDTPPVTTETPTPTVTASPPPTETTAPTISSGDPKSYLGQPVWFTSFDSGRAFGVVENDNTKIFIENGALVLSGLNANGWLGWSMTFSQQPLDFYLDAVFKTQECSGDDQYGLVFRAPDTSAAYFYGVTCDGRYFLEANDFKDNGTQAVLIRLTQSPAFQAGSEMTNRLGVMVKGDKIGVYTNGVLLQEVTDSQFKDKGYFGAFIAAYRTAGFTVRMEEIGLWNLP